MPAHPLGVLESHGLLFLRPSAFSSSKSPVNQRLAEAQSPGQHLYASKKGLPNWANMIWLGHMRQVNGSTIVAPPPDVIMFTGTSKQGWGAVCNDLKTTANGLPREFVTQKSVAHATRSGTTSSSIAA